MLSVVRPATLGRWTAVAPLSDCSDPSAKGPEADVATVAAGDVVAVGELEAGVAHGDGAWWRPGCDGVFLL